MSKKTFENSLTYDLNDLNKKAIMETNDENSKIKNNDSISIFSVEELLALVGLSDAQIETNASH